MEENGQEQGGTRNMGVHGEYAEYIAPYARLSRIYILLTVWKGDNGNAPPLQSFYKKMNSNESRTIQRDMHVLKVWSTAKD